MIKILKNHHKNKLKRIQKIKKMQKMIKNKTKNKVKKKKKSKIKNKIKIIRQIIKKIISLQKYNKVLAKTKRKRLRAMKNNRQQNKNLKLIRKTQIIKI